MVHKEILAGVQLQFNNFSGFVRNNPILSGVIGSGILATLGGLGVAVIRRRKSPTRRRKAKRRAPMRRMRMPTHRRKRHRRGVTHSSPRHSGHRRIAFTTKGGKRVSFMVKRKGGRR